MSILPTVFISHGSPTLALRPGKIGEALTNLGNTLPRPEAILVASAHWNTRFPMVSTAEKPRVIYDFNGFPKELYSLEYPAPGAAQVGERVRRLLREDGSAVGIDPHRGLDHGAWMPLRFMYPNADIPVLQISVQPLASPADHYRLGKSLIRLRGEGILIMGSGGVTHNLFDMRDGDEDAIAIPYAKEFANWIAARVQENDVNALMTYRGLAPYADQAHPTEEHFLPLFIALGAAHGEEKSLRLDLGAMCASLVMDAYVFGERN